MNKKQRISQILTRVLVICLVPLLAIFCVSAFQTGFRDGVWANAGTQLDTFARRNVLTDLESSPTFDPRQYRADTDPEAQVTFVQFVEFGFSFHQSHRQNFGLFVYLFNPNPARLDIAQASAGNTLQIRVGTHSDGRPDWASVPLQFRNSEDGAHGGRFYKFQLRLDTPAGTQLVASLNRDSRVYDISGVQLMLRPQFRVQAFNIARVVTATGFGAGIGQMQGDSTLNFEMTGRRTVEADAHPTWYRTLTHYRSRGWQHQINSVWFSVPNEVLDTFGRLQAIEAQWWQYQTQPIVVTSRQSLYNRLRPVVGQHVDQRRDLNYGLYLNWDRAGADWSFNELLGLRWWSHTLPTGVSPYLHYLFPAASIQQNLGQNTPRGTISSQQLTDWIMNYSYSNRLGYVPIYGQYISADLFTDTIDSHRLANGINRGHNQLVIDYGDRDLDFLTYWDNDPSWWQRLRDFGFWNLIGGNLPAHEVGEENIPPIFTVTNTALRGNPAEVSRRLLVRQEDLPRLEEAFDEAQRENETLFLFRFARTDYFADWLTIYDRNAGWWIFPSLTGGMLRGEAYKAQQTVFLDFNLIQLGFYGNLGKYWIPVVSSPVDLIGDSTPPTGRPPRPPFDIREWLRQLFEEYRLLVTLIVLGLGLFGLWKVGLLWPVILLVTWPIRAPIQWLAQKSRG